MVLVYMRGYPTKAHTDYLQKARHFPFWTIRRKLASASDKLFPDLKNQILKPSPSERVRQAWISDKTWAAMDARVTARQEGDQRTVRKLSRRIRAGIITDKKRQAEESGRTIDSLLVVPPPV